MPKDFLNRMKFYLHPFRKIPPQTIEGSGLYTRGPADPQRIPYDNTG
jgi:hypothetical protein